MSRRPENKRLADWKVGLIAVVLTVIGFYLAFAKSLPFTGDGYTLKAVVQDAQGIRAKSPVRVAGVDVGTVTSAENLSDENGDGVDAAVITMELDEDARPIRDDATLQLRPRLFLEGNLFVDLQPGTPGGTELETGSVIPMEQTSISVQLDQVLTTLQAPIRKDLQVFLQEFGTALCGDTPPPGGCEPGSGGEGFREAFRTSPKAFGKTAQVNEALLGTQPGDLAGFVRNFGDTIRALDRNEEQLKDFVTNLRVVTGSFAAERVALGEAIEELPAALAEGRPALAKLNDAFPQLRAFAREALPGVQAADKALDDANPFIGQLRSLVSKPELRGLVKDLRPTIPQLARLSQATVPFFEEARALSSCFNNVVIPWSNTDIPSSNGEDADVVFKETAFGLTGIAGESRSGDANGQYIRVGAGGGTNTIVTPPIPGVNGPGPAAPTFGTLLAPILGAEPAMGPKTPFHPNDPCENQEPPNLDSNVAPAPPGQTSASMDEPSTLPPELQAFADEEAQIMTRMLQGQRMEEQGKVEQGRALQRQAAEDLRVFYAKRLPVYRRLTGSGG
jgi:phospholipid/cholesterol/gamma-HCH transport system substrate-binding protein